MQTSESIKNIAAALVGFHKEVGKIKKDANNPFFKSKYASLSAILDVIDDPMVNNGLSLVQFPEGESQLTTRLLHNSGEWMEATYVMKPVKNTPQDAGSAITYQRRYAVGAILSLNIDDDDDGNVASGKGADTAKNGYQKDDKPWLNENSDVFKKAVDKLSAGLTTVAKIESSYKLSKDVKAKLSAIIPSTVN